jgi:transposase
VKYVGLDWAYRQAQRCALSSGGDVAGEGRIAADRDGLARLVLELGDAVTVCLEMMSGALWVRDELVGCGWQVEVADARKVKTVAPLAAKTDKVDARLLAELSRRELVPALWLPSLDERALRERLRRRMHLVRLRTSAKGRIFGLQTQWGVRVSLARLRHADGLTLLERAGVPAVWRRSVSECLALIDFLDARLEPLERELKPFAHADPRAALLDTIPGVGELLALTIAVEIGDISRFAAPARLVSYARLAHASTSPVKRARAAALSTNRAHACSAGRPSRPRSTPGANRTPGTTSTSTSLADPVTATRPRPRSPARS